MEKKFRTLGSFGTLLSTLKIRYETITYSKRKARIRGANLSDLETKIKECTKKCDEQPNQENSNDLEILQTEYDRQYEYIAQGAIIHSRVNWYGKKKSNKHFLNLENAKKKKKAVLES